MRYNRKRLVKARREAGMNLVEMAKALGVVPATILNWEAGTSQPDAEELGRLARVTKKSITFFYTKPPQRRTPLQTGAVDSRLTDAAKVTA